MTLKTRLVHCCVHETIVDVRAPVRDFIARDNAEWPGERDGHRSPLAMRHQNELAAMHMAAYRHRACKESGAVQPRPDNTNLHRRGGCRLAVSTPFEIRPGPVQPQEDRSAGGGHWRRAAGKRFTDQEVLRLINLREWSLQDLWTYSVTCYGLDGVQEACLALQRDQSVDVTVLLFGCWMGARGRCLDAADVAMVDGRVTGWRKDVVVPLRELRTRLRKGPFPAPSPASEALRNRIKAAELEAERLQIQVLEAEGAGLGMAALNTAEAIASNAATVVAHFSGAGPLPPTLAGFINTVAAVGPPRVNRN